LQAWQPLSSTGCHTLSWRGRADAPQWAPPQGHTAPFCSARCSAHPLPPPPSAAAAARVAPAHPTPVAPASPARAVNHSNLHLPSLKSTCTCKTGCEGSPAEQARLPAGDMAAAPGNTGLQRALCTALAALPPAPPFCQRQVRRVTYRTQPHKPGAALSSCVSRRPTQCREQSLSSGGRAA